MIDITSNKTAIISIIVPIMIVGLFGNFLNLVVLNRKQMRKEATFRFLFYLSIIDVLVLIFCTFDELLTFGFKVELRLQSLVICRIHTFLIYFLTHISSVVLMAVSLERVYAVFNQKFQTFLRNEKNSKFKKSTRLNEATSTVYYVNEESNFKLMLYNFRTYLGKHHIGASVTLVSILVGLINIHFLFLINVNSIVDENTNTAIQQSSYFLSEDSAFSLSTLAPQTEPIIFSMFVYENFINKLNESQNFELPKNDLLYIKVFNESLQSRYNEEKTKTTSALPAPTVNAFKICFPLTGTKYYYFMNSIWPWIDNSLYCLVPFVVMMFCSILIFAEIKSKTRKFLIQFAASNKNILKKRLRKRRQILLMLMATNSLFIICSMPYCILSIRMNKGDEIDPNLLFLIHTMSYLNNSINFIIYGFFSQKYRQELSNMIFKKENFNAQSRTTIMAANVISSTKNNKNKNFLDQEASLI